MNTTAVITGRTKQFVWARIPELHPIRIVTLPAETLPDGEKGDTIPVTTEGEIVANTAGGSGWTVAIWPRTEG